MAPQLLQGTFSHVINGKSVDAKGAKTLDVINPATEKPIATVPIATREVLDQAVKYGQEAFKSWGKLSWEERAKAVRSAGEEFKKITPQLVELLVAEQGKSTAFAQGEVELTQEWFDKQPDMKIEERITRETDAYRVVERYVPLGVTAGIVPWNFPVLLMVWKIIPAVLTGNTIIIKPSPFTPLCDVRIVEMLQNHLPPGVVQIVLGDDQLGPWVTEHPDIRKISFTGSTQTGKAVAKSCSATLKRFTLELGGNDAAVILPDVNVDEVAPAVFLHSFFNSGQVCHASKRVYVHADVYDKLTQALVKQAAQAGVGPGDQDGIMFGPINNKMQFDKVSKFFEESQQEGHKFLAGGEIKKGTGYFAPLTLVDQPPETSRLVQEEPFGPIVPLLKWTDEEDLLKRVNDSSWGLGATVWGIDLDRVERIARGIEAGIVWTNQIMEQHCDVAFGGFKSSGIGCENGEAGLKGWCQIQSIYLKKAAK